MPGPQAILERIQQAEPTYDHLAWAEDARKNDQFMRQICEFPPGGEIDPIEREFGPMDL